jgi:hypothetical protein
MALTAGFALVRMKSCPPASARKQDKVVFIFNFFDELRRIAQAR